MVVTNFNRIINKAHTQRAESKGWSEHVRTANRVNPKGMNKGKKKGKEEVKKKEKKEEKERGKRRENGRDNVSLMYERGAQRKPHTVRIGSRCSSLSRYSKYRAPHDGAQCLEPQGTGARPTTRGVL